MGKIDAFELLEEISHDLVVYLRDGHMKVGSFLQKVDPRIDGLRRLLEIHFVLQDEVIQFVQRLPLRIRSLRTSSRKMTDVSEGLIRGRIIWGDTIRERLRRNPADRTLHVSQVHVRDLQTKENAVLVSLLHVIRRILVNDIRPMLSREYVWLRRWEESDLIRGFLSIVDRNIYLQQIEREAITERMIRDTRQSRSPLYREAADLLSLYRNLVNPTRWQRLEDYRGLITRLLRATFISPGNDNTLFELYWIVKVIRHLAASAKLHLMESGSKMVASAEDDEYWYRVYHDSTGSRDVGFTIRVDELACAENEYTRRLYRSRRELRRLSPEIFGESSENLWSGRPDILVEVWCKESGRLVRLLIGEVKNTIDKGYATKGMEELLDYMALVKHRGQYVTGVEGRHVDVEGMLFLNNLFLDVRHADNMSVYTLQQQHDLDMRVAKDPHRRLHTGGM